MMASAWILGRRITVPNGHVYVGEPYIVFLNEAAANECADTVELVSGERPGVVEASLHRSASSLLGSKT